MGFKFDQVVALKKGDIIWESCQYGSIQIELLTDPVVTELDREEDADSTGVFPVSVERKVEFVAKSLNEKTSREINYLLNSKYMHYGPNLGLQNEYLTRAEWIAKLEAESNELKSLG